MGQPAARLGDMTAHGGAIVLGFPTVLIGGQPAARMGDMHVCPMVTPAVVPIPHVGGTVVLGSPTVLIGGQPAARMGDMLVCVGPPDVIAAGCPTVLIGEVGAGGGGAGGDGVGAAVANMVKEAEEQGGDLESILAKLAEIQNGIAGLVTSYLESAREKQGVRALEAMAAFLATLESGNKESSTKARHWVEIDFVDKAGNPVSAIPYEFTSPDGKKSESVLAADGRLKRDAMPSGQCKIRLFSVFHASWSRTTAKVGEKVKLSAEVEGFEDGAQGTFVIYKRDISQPDKEMVKLPAAVRGTAIEADWQYPAEIPVPAGRAPGSSAAGFSSPEYYFEITIKRAKARSPLLTFEDFIELVVKDEQGNPLANEEYVLHLSDGSVRKGKLDGRGYKKEEKVPAGQYTVRFPNLPRTRNE